METTFLSTLGNKPQQIKIKKKATKKQLFSLDDLSLIQRDLSLSNEQVITLAEDLRVSAGSRKIIEVGLKGKLRDFF